MYVKHGAARQRVALLDLRVYTRSPTVGGKAEANAPFVVLAYAVRKEVKMVYVNWVEYFPIYCPAEGGFYVDGQEVIMQKACKTLKEANHVFGKWAHAFRDEYDNEYYRYYENIRGGISHHLGGEGSICNASTKYIGEGARLSITSAPERCIYHYTYS